jgi:hypothetical protein
MTAVASESSTMKTALLPTTRLACGRSRAPTLWPTMMPVAMTTPNTAAISRNSTMFALVVAVSGASPRKWPTQIALTDAFSDCRTLLPSVGSVNAIRVRVIGPWVRSRAFIAVTFRLYSPSSSAAPRPTVWKSLSSVA